MGNLSGEIVFSHDTCYAAEQVTVTVRFSLFGARNRPNCGCVAQVLKEGILLTSWHLMTVLRKGKISPVHAVASNCSQ